VCASEKADDDEPVTWNVEHKDNDDWVSGSKQIMMMETDETRQRACMEKI